MEAEMNYKLIVGMTGKTTTNPSLRDINNAIDSLNADNANPFLILECTEKANNMIFMQLLQYNDYESGVPKYRIEMQINDDNRFKQYKHITNNKAEIKIYFEEYFLHQKSPDISTWAEITEEIINHENISNTFYVYELAKEDSRNKKLFDCYGLSHGDEIEGVVLYQNVAEAIILFKDILISKNNYGDIYFSNDKKRIYLDIRIPDNWKETIIDVRRFSGLLSKNNIHISCYDSNNIFISSDISPLQNLDRLLVCFMLIFAEKLLSDDRQLYDAMDYFYKPNIEKFKKLYIELLSDHKYSSYFVTYEDGDIFDLKEYFSLSTFYENYKDNMEVRNEVKSTT
jgi:hypothetical protein